MKRIITCILIGVVLYFLLPYVTRLIPHYRLIVWSVTAGLVAYVISAAMDRI